MPEQKDSTPAASPAPSSSRKEILQRLMQFCKPETGHIAVGLLALGVNAATNLSFPWILGKAVDFSRDSKSGDRGNGIMAKTAGIFLVGSLASWVRVYYLGTATDSIAVRLRRMVFDECIDMDVEMFDATTTGELVSVLEKDVKTAAQTFTDKLSAGIRSMNSAINGTVLLYCTSPRLAAVSMAVIPLVGVGAMTLAKFTRKLTAKLRTYEGELMNFVLERFSSISTVRLNSREATEKEAYKSRMDRCFALSRSSNFGQGAFMSFIGLSTNVSLMAVLYVGGKLITTGEMTAGSLTRFAMQSAFVGLGFSGLSTFYSDMVCAVDAARRVFDLVDKNKDKHSSASQSGSKAAASQVGDDSSTSIKPPSLSPTSIASVGEGESELALEDIRFTYANNASGRGSDRSQQEVLRGVSLTARAGGITAVCGKSGCGKSTLVGVIAGLYDASAGQVVLRSGGKGGKGGNAEAGDDRHQASNNALLSMVGVVEQTAGLFSGSIYDNIVYGKQGASQQDVERAARLAAAHDFTMSFPDGYNTQVGDRGQALSGGQRMRVALARALVKDPPCLLLDEATAALDKESEGEVVRALVRLSEGDSSQGRAPKIVVAVTHSEALLRAAQVVHVMDGGRVVESGDFAAGLKSLQWDGERTDTDT